jgi:hypothetical protein
MRTSIATPQRGTVEAHDTRVVFGACVVVRTSSADQIEGWIIDAPASLCDSDLDKIAAAIRRA